ncbi:hypothetical protein QWI17_22780 [Gilvimarinus sp. SDUM040013]|uniref:HTH luxR-type domain-containing protein n=1 Tax=Gilvimarinus gilvus TaxID=3058038 RepID=A0ABU4RXF9_9GAMM|nr:hypothetical protein [Gilvimarinus sp. SDUM040013]MDO3388690.1 hypothetical protein [Gilvimarinus sp. SDUM040013]MDX6849585.1 hypothetical protein [Gilvimarinus sp. SDUM040013]
MGSLSDDFRDQAIELIYETAVDVSAWRAFMALIQRELKFDVANVTLVDNQSLKPLSRLNYNNPKEYEDLYLKHFHSEDVWYQALQKKSIEGVFTPDHKVVTPEQYKASAFYNDFLRDFRIHHAIGGYWQWQGNVSARVSFLREKSISEEEERFFNSLSRHIKCALRLQRSSALAATHLSDCCAIIDKNLKIMQSSPAFNQLLHQGDLGAAVGSSLQLASRRSTSDLRKALRTLISPNQLVSESVPLVRRGRLEALLHVIPVRFASGASGDYFHITLTPANFADVSIPLQEKLGLSDAEFAICTDLAGGLSAQEVANNRCRSVNTVRKQIKDIQVKLGVNSLSGVVAIYYQQLLGKN